MRGRSKQQRRRTGAFVHWIRGGDAGFDLQALPCEGGIMLYQAICRIVSIHI